ncbi:dockerin type I domain-containing protein [bacterium]|nr:dockerin type I domain-containing protein [bacterium]
MKNRWLIAAAGALAFLIVFPLLGQADRALAQAGGSATRYAEDLNRDGQVNYRDVVTLMNLCRQEVADSRADFNGDGRLGLLDALALVLRIARGDLHPVAPVLSDKWTVIGPGGGGAMFIPTVDPFDPAHALLRCDMTGAYVTFDDGASWKMFNLRTVVIDFEFDPSNRGVVYAANTALWRSEDGGKGWSLVWPAPADITLERMVGDHAEQSFLTTSGLPDAELDKVRVDPADGDHLLVGLGQWWNGPAKVMFSHDRGASWRTLAEVPGQQVLAIFPGSWWDKPEEALIVTDLACIRANEATGDTVSVSLPDLPVIDADGGKAPDGAAALYLLTTLRKSGQSFAGGMYRSLDAGASWTQIDSSLTNTSETPTYNTLGVCQEHPEVVYLSCTSFPTNRIGIFKTTDSGTSWKWSFCEDWSSYVTKNMTDAWLTREYGHGYEGAPWGLGVCPRDPNTCYGSSGRTFRTRDGGTTWQTVYSNDMGNNAWSSRGLDVTTCYGVHFDPFDSLHVFITYTDIGLFQSHDGGKSWVHATTGVDRDVINTCYWLDFDPDTPNLVWGVWSNWHDLPRMKMFNDNWPQARGVPMYSTDGGAVWHPSNYGAPGDAPYTHVLIDPKSPKDSRTLYLCAFGKGVYKSVDGGKRWASYSEGLGENRSAWRLVRAADSTLYLVVVRNGAERNVIPGALYRSTDGARSWHSLPLPEGVSGPNDLALDPTDNRIMYLSCWPWTDRSVYPSVERNGGLYRSLDGGATWVRVFNENAHVYAAVVDPDSPATVIINTFDSAAFRSDDRGESWRRIEGYDFKWGHRPILDPHHPGMLYLTTFGGSVFYGPAEGSSAADEGLLDWSSLWRWGR